jgi:diadenosine tetraphosphatase ApaH/serine/threonine PP2A family protein phosphatase
MRAPRIAFIMQFEPTRQFWKDHAAISLGMAPTAEQIEVRTRLREPCSVGSGAVRGLAGPSGPEPCASDRNRKPAR